MRLERAASGIREISVVAGQDNFGQAPLQETAFRLSVRELEGAFVLGARPVVPAETA